MNGTTMNQLTLWDTDPLLDKHQVAERLNVGIRFVERLIAEKRIAYIKVGRHVRMRASVVDAFVSQHHWIVEDLMFCSMAGESDCV